MAHSWKHEEIFKFIELYKHEPCLWHPNNRFYKDKNKIKEAWERIEKVIKIPITELKRKKETLMTTFRYHFKKKKISLRGGYEDEYEPVWIFYNSLECFLRQIYESYDTVINKSHTNESPHSSKEYQPPQSSPSPAIPESQREEREATKRKFPELTIARRQMEQAINILCSISNQVQTDPDEVDLFCQLLAKRLKQFRNVDREVVMHDIDQLVYTKKFENHRMVTVPASDAAFKMYTHSPPGQINGDSDD